MSGGEVSVQRGDVPTGQRRASQDEFGKVAAQAVDPIRARADIEVSARVRGGGVKNARTGWPAIKIVSDRIGQLRDGQDMGSAHGGALRSAKHAVVCAGAAI